jgi:hypothetical protein
MEPVFHLPMNLETRSGAMMRAIEAYDDIVSCVFVYAAYRPSLTAVCSSICSDETPEEKALKEEVERLRLKLQGGGGSQPAAAEVGEGEDKQENGVHEEKASEDVEAELAKKEKELDDLIRKLDDKVGRLWVRFCGSCMVSVCSCGL